METVGSGAIENLQDLRERLTADESLKQVVEALRAGNSGTIDGVWGSSKAMALAALADAEPTRSQKPKAKSQKPKANLPPASQAAQRMLVIVLAHASDVDPIVDDLRSFTTVPPIVFPALEEMRSDSRRTLASEETFGRRLAILKLLAGSCPPRIVVTTIHALLQPVPSMEKIRRGSRLLQRGKPYSLDELLAWLTARGWHRRDAVEIPGEFSLRGGILDVFPADASDPLRIEFFGDEVESIREFSVQSQRSLQEVDSIDLTALQDYGTTDSDLLPPANSQQPKAKSQQPKAKSLRNVHFGETVPEGTWFGLVEPTELQEEGKRYLSRLEDPGSLYSVEATWSELLKWPTVVLSSLPTGSVETTCTLQVESVERFSGEATKICEELDRAVAGDQLLLVCHNEAEVGRLGELLKMSQSAGEGRLHFSVGRLSAGFRWISAGVVAISDYQLFQRTETRRTVRRSRYQGRAIDSFLDLHDGDYVVHLAHGISIFRGMKMLEKNGQLEEHLTLEFYSRVFVYVSASKIDLVQRYVGSNQTRPKLSKIGGVAWERRKRLAQLAVQDMASDLLDIQAVRQTQPGIAYPSDSNWLGEFEASFPFVETPDQLLAWEMIREDLELARPMDRLICGDVGYGKTELAMRAAFKAVDFGKQVAVLVPTTVLAQQHLRTFRERMAEFPFVVECISRFQSRSQQRKILEETAQGSVDILIGTHRLLSGDVRFADLGLVVVDEEQRFGVAHKERLKRMRSQVDVMTMTATPIPRTLHSALLGIRDISNLQTPPEDRLAIETRIGRFDHGMIRHAILRELNRDGQVYFVHNRVQDIRIIADRLRRIVPEARIVIVHGQLPEHEITDGMLAFLERRADILLATTIIESGLDIPNSNTIFINEGDRYGLADLHQLRGRVGRAKNRAYCYVLIDEHKVIKPDAQRRLKAIEEYSSLGSGFQIALRDLEIRGAGNLLGSQQSGHIAAIGYELYCKLLEDAAATLKGQPLRTMLDVTIELPWKVYLPHDYLPGERHRIETYRRLAQIRDLEKLKEFGVEMKDRFGKIPEIGHRLIDLAELRILAHGWQIETIRPDEEGHLVLTYRNRSRMEDLEKLRNREVLIVDDKSAYIRVPPIRRNAQSYAILLKRILQPIRRSDM